MQMSTHKTLSDLSVKADHASAKVAGAFPDPSVHPIVRALQDWKEILNVADETHMAINQEHLDAIHKALTRIEGATESTNSARFIDIARPALGDLSRVHALTALPGVPGKWE